MIIYPESFTVRKHYKQMQFRRNLMRKMEEQ